MTGELNLRLILNKQLRKSNHRALHQHNKIKLCAFTATYRATIEMNVKPISKRKAGQGATDVVKTTRDHVKKTSEHEPWKGRGRA